MKFSSLYGVAVASVVTLTGDRYVIATGAEETKDASLVLKSAQAVGLLCPAVAPCQLEMGTAFGGGFVPPFLEAHTGDAGYFKVIEFHAY